MKRFCFKFLSLVSVILILIIGGFSNTDKQTDNTESLKKNDKILIGALINISSLINKEQLSPDKIDKLEIKDKEIIDYTKEISNKIKNLKKSEKLSFLIDKIKNLNKEKDFIDYINSLKDYILKNGKIDNIYENWYSFTGSGLSFILIPQDNSQKYGIIIYKKDDEKVKTFNKNLERYQEFISTLPVNKDNFQQFPILKKSLFIKKIFSNIKVDDIFIYPDIGEKLFYSQRGIFVSENSDKNGDYKNIGKKYLKNKTEIDENMILYLKLYHIIFHSVGPFFNIKNNEKHTVEESLKELFYPIEETKAEILSFLFTDYLFRRGKTIDNSIKSYFIIYLLNKKILKNKDSITPNLILNYLIEKGGISKEDKKIIVNKGKFNPAIYILLKNIAKIESEGDYSKALNFIRAYKKQIITNRK